MPTESDDYAQRFLDWQAREAAARAAEELALPPPERAYAVWEGATQMREDEMRHRWYRRRVLESIDNLELRDIVREIHHLASRQFSVIGLADLPWKRSDSNDYLKNSNNVSSDALVYRDWIWEELRKSGLGQRIPWRREALPDIYEAMQEPFRSFEKMFEPSSYEQLVAHLVKHLDWYLDPSQKVKPPFGQIAAISLAPMFIVVWMLYTYSPTAMDPMWASIAWIFFSGLAFILSMLWGRQKTPRGEVFNFYKVRTLIHAAELYYYLVAEYVDPSVLEIPHADIVTAGD